MLYEELLKRGLKRFWPSERYELGVTGSAEFESFKHAFQVLTEGSSIKGVTFQHQWYTNWDWITSASRDGAFFENIERQLNDDCICEILKYIDILHRIFFASINERFRAITLVKDLTRNLCVSPSSVGTIGLMNFRFILEMFGSLVMNLSVSLSSFDAPFGIYFTHNKTYILDIIYECTGPNLKKINLCDFDLNEIEEKKISSIVQLFVQRGVELKFSSN